MAQCRSMVPTSSDSSSRSVKAITLSQKVLPGLRHWFARCLLCVQHDAPTSSRSAIIGGWTRTTTRVAWIWLKSSQIRRQYGSMFCSHWHRHRLRRTRCSFRTQRKAIKRSRKATRSAQSSTWLSPRQNDEFWTWSQVCKKLQCQ